MRYYWYGLQQSQCSLPKTYPVVTVPLLRAECVPSTTYFLDFREEPGTWYPGLHLYLQKEPTLCLLSRHLAVCRSALGTGGGARHMSSHRASGKDHSPSSIQVRMLLLPGKYRQAGLAEQWVPQKLR